MANQKVLVLLMLMLGIAGVTFARGPYNGGFSGVGPGFAPMQRGSGA